MGARRTTTVAAPAPAPNPVAQVCLWLLIGAVVGSAFLVIHSSHACRQLYAELQTLEADQWFLQEDYSRLLLEQSTWASHHRVEKVATSELDMHSPVVEQLRVVKP